MEKHKPRNLEGPLDVQGGAELGWCSLLWLVAGGAWGAVGCRGSMMKQFLQVSEKPKRDSPASGNWSHSLGAGAGGSVHGETHRQWQVSLCPECRLPPAPPAADPGTDHQWSLREAYGVPGPTS